MLGQISGRFTMHKRDMEGPAQHAAGTGSPVTGLREEGGHEFIHAFKAMTCVAGFRINSMGL